MPLADLLREGEHVMTVCNACRYCEQYCPVFPAMENRLTFAKGDLMYLANLCHNCGECLYACQYAPPHEFGIDVPRTLAKIRGRSYEEYCWPRGLGVAFRHQGILTSVGLAVGLTAMMFGGALLRGATLLSPPNHGANFYAVVPHDVMVGLFTAVSLFVVIALVVGARRFWRETDRQKAQATPSASIAVALRDALTLKHLHGSGIDCTSAQDDRTPWRRWFHHCTMYGFMLCFASTVVAAIYHTVFGWRAPYGVMSAPVVLGTVGGIGLLVGPVGLLVLRRRRDPALGDPGQAGLDESFITLMLLTTITGLLLLVLRQGTAMGPLLITHLGVVLALFVSLPYGKFVHGIYRTAALVRYTGEAAGYDEETVIAETGERSTKVLQDDYAGRPSGFDPERVSLSQRFGFGRSASATASKRSGRLVAPPHAEGVPPHDV